MSSPAALPAHLWTLDSGLTVAFERRQGPGFAFDLRIPVGSAHDPRGQEGAAGVLEEWLSKGAGGRDARALGDAFDDLGVRRGGGVGPEATRVSLSGLSADLPAALGLVADLVLRPELPPGELPVLTDLARQDLEALEESPPDRLAVEARRAAFPPDPASPHAGYVHPASGTREGLSRLTPEGLRAFHAGYPARGSVLGLVADADPGEVRGLVERAFAGWNGGEPGVVPARFVSGARAHIPHPEAEQTHLSVTASGISPLSPDWLRWQLALTALSGGSASRLFHAVREERGLAYSVGASPVVLGGQGFVSVYAGSTPGRAGETLEVLLAELGRLGAGLEPAEFERARRGLLAGVVFGAESLRSRAGGLTRDLALFGRVRPLAELRAAVSALTLDDVNAFLAGYDPLAGATVVTLGPEAAGQGTGEAA
ncbi:pitrilysin family protein [Deinococcus sp. MIMF12]|uniref:Pitrilysin family protein n=1 Tax=Deinococcus rhizophilus TaxID=3049544 RepID=A0ABT7JE20_9DEIO|nr:pitrilysin family protein [Deinococcus rhizophilus]MDL2342723.1 pitrilysin family protein [Deinococcus rhizophilus]